MPYDVEVGEQAVAWLISVERFPPPLALLKENLAAESAARKDHKRVEELGGPVVSKEQVHRDIEAYKLRSAERYANDLEAKTQAEELRREVLAEQKRKVATKPRGGGE